MEKITMNAINAYIHVILVLFLSGEIVMYGADIQSNNNPIAYFAGGCFWCMEPPFEKEKGVSKVISGYMGGSGESPTYKTYAQQGYIETVAVHYDPKVISYAKLLDIFWRNIDPTDAGGQFGDRGPAYQSVIFYKNENEQQEALVSKKQLAESGRFKKPIVTELVQASSFYPAEEYHQDYAEKNPVRYKWYRYHSGRDQFLKKAWKTVNEKTKTKNVSYKKPSQKELKTKLTPLQYHVTQENGTEKPFDNEYWDTMEPGIYVDIVSGEPLFSSVDKFKSATGWPSFTKSLEKNNIVEKKEWFGFGVTEVRSKHADSHLGHLFKDGPPPTGLRYCINSAALRFVPEKDIEKEGYVFKDSLTK